MQPGCIYRGVVSVITGKLRPGAASRGENVVTLTSMESGKFYVEHCLLWYSGKIRQLRYSDDK